MKNFLYFHIVLIMHSSSMLISMDNEHITQPSNYEQLVDNDGVCAPCKELLTETTSHCRQNRYPVGPQCIYCCKREKINQRILPRLLQRTHSQNSAS